MVYECIFHLNIIKYTQVECLWKKLHWYDRYWNFKILKLSGFCFLLLWFSCKFISYVVCYPLKLWMPYTLQISFLYHLIILLCNFLSSDISLFWTLRYSLLYFVYTYLTINNHVLQVCRFLEVSKLSFSPEYGPKLKEDYVMVKHLPKIPKDDDSRKCCACHWFNCCNDNWQKVINPSGSWIIILLF